MTRRSWLQTAAGAAMMQSGPSLVTITFDCEMSARFPQWDMTEWNFKKGELDEASKEYSVGAARRVSAAGGKMHFFIVGRVFEQPSVAWLEEIVKLGHGVGNHTYDHVNITATEMAQVQYRFQRAPWLVSGKTPRQVIEENIRMCTQAFQQRLGRRPDGFRTPGGFPDGLRSRRDLQDMLLQQGFTWVSSLYPRHPIAEDSGKPQSGEVEEILKRLDASQPFVYPSGLVELPMSPPSDVTTMRTGRWKLPAFADAVKRALEWSIAHGKHYDFLAHPSAIGVLDPGFQVVDMIIDTVKRAGPRARLVRLETVVEAVRR